MVALAHNYIKVPLWHTLLGLWALLCVSLSSWAQGGGTGASHYRSSWIVRRWLELICCFFVVAYARVSLMINLWLRHICVAVCRRSWRAPGNWRKTGKVLVVSNLKVCPIKRTNRFLTKQISWDFPARVRSGFVLDCDDLVLLCLRKLLIIAVIQG